MNVSMKFCDNYFIVYMCIRTYMRIYAYICVHKYIYEVDAESFFVPTNLPKYEQMAKHQLFFKAVCSTLGYISTPDR